VTSRARVLVARALPADGLALLRERFDVETGVLEPGEAAAPEALAGAQALVADPTVPVDEALLNAIGPSLRIVANFAVGYDNVDLAACQERGIVVTITPDVLTNATAELALTLMLAAGRRLGEAERLLRAGRWSGWNPGQLLGRELAGTTVAIVGLGRIGSRLAELLSGFGVRLLYSSRHRKAELEERLGLTRRELADATAEADFVSLHLPLTPETRGSIDADALGRFKPGSILVNTARGALLDTDALIAGEAGGRERDRGARGRPGCDPDFVIQTFGRPCSPETPDSIATLSSRRRCDLREPYICSCRNRARHRAPCQPS
jgi:glyoxylate reductase